MWFRLALALGSTVGELMERMSSAEFTYWCAFYRLEPFGCEVEDWRTALVSATTANAGGGKKGGKPFKPAEFMPRRGKKKRVDVMAQRKQVEAALHGKVRSDS